MADAAPAIDPEVLAALPSILAECCCPWTGSKYDLRRPWQEGAWLYATDGRILARMHRDAIEWHVWRAIPRRRRHAMVNTNKPGWVGAQPRAGPAFDELVRGGVEPDPLRLPVVLTGFQHCEECRGEGVTEWVNQETGGRYECYMCSGSGSWTDGDPYEVAPGYYLGGWLVALLTRHGATAYRCKAGGSEPPVYFRTDQVEGVAMAMDPDAARHRIEELTR